MDARELKLLEKWLYNKIPLLGNWFRRRTARTLARVLRDAGDASVAAILAEAVTRSGDPGLRQIAVAALREMTSRPCIDRAAAVWEQTRHLALTQLLVEQAWIASAPIHTRILSALKVGQSEFIGAGGAEVVAPLLAACEDGDAEIAGRARALLTQLRRVEAKEALCQFVLAHDHPIAQEAALSAGYLPREAAPRALFLFLTAQWERYEAFDFDHALLSAAHRAAAPELRRRIADKLRAAGRTDFLTVLVGADYRSRAAEMTPLEADVLVRLLADKREWSKLWQLVFELPFIWSSQIIQMLKQAGWRPERGDEHGIFAELGTLAAAEMVISESEARRVLPLALSEATVRVNGRVNDVAFAPDRPVIAIGVGNRKVARWNFQQGAIEQVYRGFAHAIGVVTFLPDGTLLCAERTNTSDAPCAIYICRENENILLGTHEGSVTALEAVGERQLLSTGRDQKIILWDVPERRKVQETNLTFWPRAAKVSPDGQHLAVLHKAVSVLSLPELERIVNWPTRSVGQCAAFAPNASLVIVGKADGQVQAYDYREPAERARPLSLQRHHGRVTGVAALRRNAGIIITAGSEGTLHFTNWTNREFLGAITVPNSKFTALHPSPDNAFMATGDADAALALWDLRVQEIPRLFTRPLAQASPDHLVAISELAANAQLAPNVRQSLRFIQKVLQYRLRFDIEIDEVPAIKVGAFDIEIE